jgi:hypothetical protein
MAGKVLNYAISIDFQFEIGALHSRSEHSEKTGEDEERKLGNFGEVSFPWFST